MSGQHRRDPGTGNRTPPDRVGFPVPAIAPELVPLPAPVRPYVTRPASPPSGPPRGPGDSMAVIRGLMHAFYADAMAPWEARIPDSWRRL